MAAPQPVQILSLFSLAPVFPCAVLSPAVAPPPTERQSNDKKTIQCQCRQNRSRSSLQQQTDGGSKGGQLKDHLHRKDEDWVQLSLTFDMIPLPSASNVFAGVTLVPNFSTPGISPPLQTQNIRKYGACTTCNPEPSFPTHPGPS